MKCRVHGYRHYDNCKYCNDVYYWVDDNYETTEKDKKLKWEMK